MKKDKEEVLVKEMLRTGIVGFVEHKGLIKTGLHFSEWWNGEGLDIVLSGSDHAEEQRLNLHIDEMTLLAAVMLKSGYIDLEEVKELAEEIDDKGLGEFLD